MTSRNEALSIVIPACVDLTQALASHLVIDIESMALSLPLTLIIDTDERFEWHCQRFVQPTLPGHYMTQVKQLLCGGDEPYYNSTHKIT